MFGNLHDFISNMLDFERTAIPRNPIPSILRHFYTRFPSYVGFSNKSPLQNCTACSRTTEMCVTLCNEVDATSRTWGDRTGAM